MKYRVGDILRRTGTDYDSIHESYPELKPVIITKITGTHYYLGDIKHKIKVLDSASWIYVYGRRSLKAILKTL